MLYLAQATIKTNTLHKWMKTRRLEDLDHAMHCLLRETLGAEAPKTFRLFHPTEDNEATLYGYTNSPAPDLQQVAAATADPIQEEIMEHLGIRTKPMPDTWQTGQTLNFNIRARPIKQTARGGQKPGSERDVYQREETDLPREQIYEQWLSEKLNNTGAAQVQRLRITAYKQVDSQRKRNRPRVSGPDVTFQGTFTIQDPLEFTALLSRGTGRHKAYGYGMILLRPAT